jgi:hypothetical protein
MSSPEIQQESPTDKVELQVAEDVENNSTKADATGDNNARVEITEEEVLHPTVDGSQKCRPLTLLLGSRIREFVARLIKPS